MRVDFMLIGAQKAGTTSLAAQLADHPEVCFSRIKEPGFFNAAENWRSAVDDYHRLFEPENGQLCGEGSTMYTFLPETPETSARIHAYNPDLKLIYIMRNPVDRVISHYAHNVVRGLEKQSAGDAIASDGRYINRSRYGIQLEPYLELFGRDNILLLVFEEYVADQYAELKKIADFLNISESYFGCADTAPKHKSVGEPYIRIKTVSNFTQSDFFRSIRTLIPGNLRQFARARLLSNTLEEKPEFGPALRDMIWRFTAGDVEIVEDLLGRNLQVWRQGYC